MEMAAPPYGRGRLFPGREATVRLVGTVLMERNDERTEARRYMGPEVLAKISASGMPATNRPEEVNVIQAISA